MQSWRVSRRWSGCSSGWRRRWGLLDDVGENLAIFDVKLRHMREDIAAIEARNNRLELQTRNNGKLLETLEWLLAKLQLSPAVERALRDLSFDDDACAPGFACLSQSRR